MHRDLPRLEARDYPVNHWRRGAFLALWPILSLRTLQPRYTLNTLVALRPRLAFGAWGTLLANCCGINQRLSRAAAISDPRFQNFSTLLTAKNIGSEFDNRSAEKHSCNDENGNHLEGCSSHLAQHVCPQWFAKFFVEN